MSFKEHADICRCNVGGLTGAATSTITVKAGDPFTFTTDTAVYHNGPLSMYVGCCPIMSRFTLTISRYMAKAPSTAAAFDGSGQVWFKILDLGPTFLADGSVTWPLSRRFSLFEHTLSVCLQAS
jgi:hypothetical protein